VSALIGEGMCHCSTHSLAASRDDGTGTPQAKIHVLALVVPDGGRDAANNQIDDFVDPAFVNAVRRTDR
jgi:hypothetical protein